MPRYRVLTQCIPRLVLGLFGLALCMVGTGVLYLADAESVSAAQTVPYRVNFQGRLTNASGAIVADGLYNMQFRLYDLSSGGTLLWSETRETTNRVQVTNGLFSVQLGSVTALSPTLFDNAAARHLEVTMATPATATCSTASCASWESPMTPRQALASSTYALNSDLLDGQDGTYYQDASNLNAGTVSAARLSGSYTGITGTGALAAGSIASGFGTIVTGNTIQGSRFISTVATGTAPLTVSSSTKVTSLNVDWLDGLDSTAFASSSGSANYIQNTTTAQSASFNISGSGNVASLSASNLTVNGTMWMNPPGVDNGIYLCHRSSDNLVVRVWTGCSTASSIRYKENVTSLGASVLDLLNQLRPVSFDWKAGTGTAMGGGVHDYGLIAEEVRDVLPHVVAYGANGEVTGLNYQGFIPFLMQAIKEQQSQIATLQARDSTMSALQVIGDATIGGNLNVSGTSTVGALIVSGAAEFRGTLIAQDATFTGTLTVNGHLVSQGGAPTITPGQALGAGLAAVNGTDSAGTVSMAAGATQAAAGVLAHVNFTQVFDTSYKVVLSATNDNAADIKVYIVKTATGFDVVTRGPLTAGLQYEFDYIVVGAKTVD